MRSIFFILFTHYFLYNSSSFSEGYVYLLKGEISLYFFRLFLSLLVTSVFSISLTSWTYIDPSLDSLTYLDRLSQPAKAVYVLDVNSESILYEKNSDRLFNPASMTKIVVLDIAYDYIKSHDIPLETLIPISRSADYRNSPPHSSLMFLQEGQFVNLEEILKGIAIPSGNDATIALAEFISGSEEAFVQKMNDHVSSLGFTHMNFVDTSGYSSDNFVTAEEMSLFTCQYIKKHPEALRDLHSLRFFTFPEDRHGGNRGLPFFIKQENKNYLLRDYEGADGVKTGFIDEVGYNLMATAIREDRRVIVSIIGIEGNDPEEATQKRSSIASKLLDYAFDFYQEIYIPQEVSYLPLLGSTNSTVSLKMRGSPFLLVPKDESGSLNKRIYLLKDKGYISAPIESEAVVGSVCYIFKGKILKESPLYVEEQPYKGIFKWLWDYVKYQWSSFIIKE